MAPLLEVQDLAVSYGPVAALRGVSFRVDAGSTVSLVGANGAGKTTTLLAISGVIRRARGSLRLDGQEIGRLKPPRIVERGVSQVPEGRAILPAMTVLENLEMGGFLRRDRAGLAKDMSAMMERFPLLGERRRQLAGSLSGGEQQMLAIARALLARPRLLLMDEPSMGLAPQMVRTVFEIVQEIKAEGTAQLLVEQNARKALAVSDYAYVLELGEIVLEGPAASVATDPRMVSAYLGGSVRTAPSP